MVKILFVLATNTSSKLQTHYPPLGPAYLASYLRKRFGRDAVECKIVNSDVEKHIVEFAPDIIGISSVTMNYNFAVEYAKLAKKYSLSVVIGGYHISSMPSSLTEDMDIGVIGEGEATLAELVEIFMRHGKFDKSKLEKVDGIIYKDLSGAIKQTKKRDPIRPIDEIPIPARDLLQIGDDAHIFTSRGCPYNCIFCASTRFWSSVRYFSAEYVFEEIKYLIDAYHVKHIHFYDDLFVANRERIVRITQLLENNGYLGKVTFSCQARANLMDDKLGELLKKLGFKSIGIGFESGCDDTLRYLKGESVTVEDNERAIAVAKKFGIGIYGSFIIGAPQETKEDILKTFDFIKHSKLDGFDMNIFTPLPGTPVWDYAKSRGLVNDSMEWKKLNTIAEDFDNAIILSEKLSKEELHELFKMFQKEKSRRNMLYLIKSGITRPLSIPRYLKSLKIFDL